METIFALFALFMLSVTLWHHRKKLVKLLPKGKPKPAAVEEDPFAEFKRYAAKQRKHREEDHAYWEGQAYAILAKTCSHIYHQYGDEWYICVECRQEEPWEYKNGCECQFAVVKSLTEAVGQYEVIKRKTYCKYHGTDQYSRPYSDLKVTGHRGSIKHRSLGGRTFTDAYEVSKSITNGRTLVPIFQVKGTN